MYLRLLTSCGTVAQLRVWLYTQPLPLTAAPMLLPVPLTALHLDKGPENMPYEFSEQLRVGHSHTCRFSEVSGVGERGKGKRRNEREVGRQKGRERERKRKGKQKGKKGGGKKKLTKSDSTRDRTGDLECVRLT